MLGDHTREQLQYKLTKIEADRELFGWTTTHPAVHVITISGGRLRYQQQAVPAGVALGDLPHEQVEAYVHAPNTGNPLAVPGQPIAVSYTSELCGSCVHSLWPRVIHRRWHHRRHQPIVRMLVAVDISGFRYLAGRRRGETEAGLIVVTPAAANSSDDSLGESLVHAMNRLLAAYAATHGSGPSPAVHGSAAAEPEWETDRPDRPGA